MNVELEEKGDGGVSNSSGWEVEALPQRHFTFSHPEMESEKRVAATAEASILVDRFHPFGSPPPLVLSPLLF